MKKLDFLCPKMMLIEVKNKICINVFCYERKLTYSVQKFKNSMHLILDKIKSHYVCIKDF